MMMTTTSHDRCTAMKAFWALCLALCLASFPGRADAQQKRDRKEGDHLSNAQMPAPSLTRQADSTNKSNIGSYFVNYGKLYAPDDYSQGPTFEWRPPGRSDPGTNFVYRANPYVRYPGQCCPVTILAPLGMGAAAGYNNRDSAQVAFSDRPFTWPPADGR